MDHEQRETQSEVMAQGFLIELLLSLYMERIPQHNRQNITDRLVQSFLAAPAAVQLSDDQAEILADLRVRASDHVRKHLESAADAANYASNENR